MKKFIAALFLATSFSAVAAPVFITPTCSTFTGECTLYNTSGKDINCNIQINGYTKSGRPLHSYEYRFLYSGMFAWIRIFNPNSQQDPITVLYGNASCNTVQ